MSQSPNCLPNKKPEMPVALNLRPPERRFPWPMRPR